MDPEDDEKLQPDSNAIKDAFLAFMQSLLKDYELFFKDIFYNTDGSLAEKLIAEDCFKFDQFRVHSSATWDA